MIIRKGHQFNAGNFVVSIGIKDTEVAIISKSSGDFAKLKTAGKKLKSVKRKFKSWLNSDETFTFSHMQPGKTIELIELLRK